MGTTSCNPCNILDFCDERQSHEYNLKGSYIEKYPSVEKSEEISINLFDEDTYARVIQMEWYKFKSKQELEHLRRTRRCLHTYFSMREVKETLRKSRYKAMTLKRAKFYYKDGGVYIGECLGGFRHGFGFMKWKDGSQYEGLWSYSFAFGKGTFQYASGEQFSGNWICPYPTLSTESSNSLLDAWLHTRSKIILKDKIENSEPANYTRYSSVILEGNADSIITKNNENIENIKKIKKMIGESFGKQFSKYYKSEEIANGEQYTGEWSNDKRSGLGRNVWPNSEIYEGFWSNDMQNGYGRLLSEDSSEYYGSFKNNDKDGLGECVYKNKEMFIGEWKYNVIDGFGSYSWGDGSSYIGEWKTGRMEGFGIMLHASKVISEGYWKNGKLHITNK